jgi:hypothetical protein
MRCPYCGVVNKEGAAFCTHCGRDIARQTQQSVGAFPPKAPSYPPMSQQRPPSTVPTAQPVQPSQRIVYPPNATMGPAPVRQPRVQQNRPATQQPMMPPPPITYPSTNTTPAQSARSQPTDTPPAPFPPKSIAQLHALEAGALAYTLIDNTTSYGRRKVVRIRYARCSPWQQIATLTKAWREYDDPTLDTIIIQGFFATGADTFTDSYGYTNGQLLFNRNVRLGSQIQQRYQIETGNGFENNSLRIVLSE